MTRALILLTLIAAPAWADDPMAGLKAMQAASGIGTLMASEKYCGLTYDQAAITAYVTAQTPAGDLNFAQQIDVGRMGEEFAQKDRPDSGKTAHCAAIAKAAADHGFIKP
ncbi:hypothetical protein ACEYYA_00795 [Paracoccus sp. p3-h83]|uniref:hypothetical protein n=1 Tax=Paracoccus sp. p3-h83 TaxID=3342805 RepID=UPI0035B9C094